MGVKWQKQSEYALFTVTGRLVVDEALQAIDEVFGTDPCPHAIWDFTQAVLPLSLPLALKEVSEHSAKHWDARGRGAKTAVVTDNEMDRRNLAPLGARVKDVDGIEMAIFSTVSQAVAWVEEA